MRGEDDEIVARRKRQTASPMTAAPHTPEPSCRCSQPASEARNAPTIPLSRKRSRADQAARPPCGTGRRSARRRGVSPPAGVRSSSNNRDRKASALAPGTPGSPSSLARQAGSKGKRHRNRGDGSHPPRLHRLMARPRSRRRRLRVSRSLLEIGSSRHLPSDHENDQGNARDGGDGPRRPRQQVRPAAGIRGGFKILLLGVRLPQ